MSEAKYTPGPWKWCRPDPAIMQNRQEDIGREDLWNTLEHEPITSGVPTVLTYSLVEGDVCLKCDPANARLIAAAPALLSACKHLLDDGRTIPAVERAEAAIALAEEGA